ncbi:MAG TPA: hypothetical protein VJW93_06935, partial [Candidatus Acidoferrales bacterium]|nr:hypothetical protein [Candidatus Acidoferrales bacterium]
HTVYKPDPASQRVYDQLYPLYKRLYFDFGVPAGTAFGDVLPLLIKIAHDQTSATKQKSEAVRRPEKVL